MTFDFTGSLPYKQSSIQGKLYDKFYKINKKYYINSCIHKHLVNLRIFSSLKSWRYWISAAKHIRTDFGKFKSTSKAVEVSWSAFKGDSL